MPTITFEIEGSKYSVDVNTVDPNRLYRSFDKVINAVNDAGWEFTSEAAKPDYDEISNIGRTSDGSDIHLGDISSRVRQASTSDGEGDVIVTVKGPNGRSERFGLGAKLLVRSKRKYLNSGILTSPSVWNYIRMVITRRLLRGRLMPPMSMVKQSISTR